MQKLAVLIAISKSLQVHDIMLQQASVPFTARFKHVSTNTLQTCYFARLAKAYRLDVARLLHAVPNASCTCRQQQQ